MRALVGSGPALSFSARSIYTSQVCHILPISRPVLARRAVLPLNATWKDEVEWAPSEVEEITSLQNSTVKHCVKLRTQRGYREEHQAVILTGADLVEELPPTVEMLTLFFIKDEDSSLAQPSTRRIAVSTAVMAKITGLETVAPTTLAAEVILPEPVDLRKWAGPPLQRLLVLERCQDPGNLGTLLRTAVALGWDAVFLLPGCADPYNDKSIRASRGACFKLPIQRGTMEEWMEVSARHGLTPIAAELDRRKGGNGSNGAGNGAAEEALGAVAGARVSLVLGSEGQGVSREMLEMCTPVAISMLGDMESLNVAAAGSIFMWALSPGAPMLLAELGAALGPQGAGAAAGSFGK